MSGIRAAALHDQIINRLNQRIATLEAENLRLLAEHADYCDIREATPDGIRKPCNCYVHLVEQNRRLRSILTEAFELFDEIEAQWKSDYLWTKWQLTSYIKALKVQAALNQEAAQWSSTLS